MYGVEREINFDLSPVKEIPGTEAYTGCDAIVNKIAGQIKSRRAPKTVLVFDYYHGVNENKILNEIIGKLQPDYLIDSNDFKYPEEIIQEKFGHFITDDRIFGVFSWGTVAESFDQDKIRAIQEKIENETGLIVVYGVAASVVMQGDITVSCNISLQEIKNRYAKGMDNWGAGNYDDDPLSKEKRALFLEFRMQNLHKRTVLKTMDFMIDCNRDEDFVMISRMVFDKTVTTFASSPFKLVPIFTKGIWGGSWSQEVLGAGKDLPNTAWGITGLMDWQAVRAKCGDAVVEFPSTDLYFYNPKDVLGRKIFYLYGYKCPIHVNFLDTWGGENLSLQVHPTLDYAHDVFNSHYGHYESYYMLDTTEESAVYLGTKTGVKLDELVAAFEEAQESGEFDDEKYINQFPMKKHDHVFIPSGTIHASGRNTLALEIDLFCFATFKLWDWGRVDYDGKPRPINIRHGKHVIQEEFQTEFIKDNMISKQQEIMRGDGWRKERSGTMPYEAPMEVMRYWLTKSVHLETDGGIVILVLVEGEEAIVESPVYDFEPVILHYAEAMFVPARVGQYTIQPYGKSEGKEIAILECFNKIG